MSAYEISPEFEAVMKLLKRKLDIYLRPDVPSSLYDTALMMFALYEYMSKSSADQAMKRLKLQLLPPSVQFDAVQMVIVVFLLVLISSTCIFSFHALVSNRFLLWNYPIFICLMFASSKMLASKGSLAYFYPCKCYLAFISLKVRFTCNCERNYFIVRRTFIGAIDVSFCTAAFESLC